MFKHIALPTPTEREKSQMYVQRYIAHFPAAGEVAIFDRSWYNCAGVEPVMGYCTQEQSEKFIELLPAVEKAMVDNGIILIKYWLNVSVDEQTRRDSGAGRGHGREVVRALAWRCRAQARCRPRQRHLSSEGRGAAEDERAERTVIRSLSE